ncbi:hypothetical protein DFH06DRAFT_1480567 [Mycena polygramma]|nr:hypothetical protein DFH06DRAFT_1480567 [Mycena polygramma]
MSARRLSLHPSALSDFEYTLFTASLADLADVDPHRARHRNRLGADKRQRARGARAALRALCGAGILPLFPAPRLGGGAFFAVLQLVLHVQASSAIDRRPAFVRAPVPAAPIPGASASHRRAPNPFLPTPAPSPEARPRKTPFPTNNAPPTPDRSRYGALSESSAGSSTSSSHSHSARHRSSSGALWCA